MHTIRIGLCYQHRMNQIVTLLRSLPSHTTIIWTSMYTMPSYFSLSPSAGVTSTNASVDLLLPAGGQEEAQRSSDDVVRFDTMDTADTVRPTASDYVVDTDDSLSAHSISVPGGHAMVVQGGPSRAGVRAPIAARTFLSIRSACSSDQSCRITRITKTSPAPCAVGNVPAGAELSSRVDLRWMCVCKGLHIRRLLDDKVCCYRYGQAQAAPASRKLPPVKFVRGSRAACSDCQTLRARLTTCRPCGRALKMLSLKRMLCKAVLITVAWHDCLI